MFSTAATITITAIVLVLGASQTLTADPCAPDCNGHLAGDKVPDPNNCTQYYLCLGDGSPTDHAIACENDGHFDTITNQCAPGKDCTPICEPQACKVSCKDPGNLIAHPKDCRKYYICDAALEATGPFDCPIDKPYFNGNTCIKDDSQCCKPRCDPYCNEGDVQIIDPKDCHKYYICTALGKPGENTHFSCPAGSNFDIASARCKDGAQCVILCDDPAITTAPPVTPKPTGKPVTTTGSSSGCLTSFTCPAAGIFAVCNYCDPRYFYCSQVGVSGTINTCPDGKLFNPTPSYPYCVLASNCPYNPFL